MAFPQTAAPTETQFTSDTTAHAVAMPATVNSGDLLIILIMESEIHNFATPSGWTLQVNSETAPGAQFAAYVKVADGTEGGTTVDVVSDDTTEAAAHVYRITGWFGDLAGVENGTAALLASSINPNPPSVTASWGALDNLWIACFGARNDDETIVTGPSGYSGVVDTVAGGGTDAGATVGSATLENATDTEDPGTFEITDVEEIAAQTLVIRPARGGFSPSLFHSVQKRSTLLRM